MLWMNDQHALGKFKPTAGKCWASALHSAKLKQLSYNHFYNRFRTFFFPFTPNTLCRFTVEKFKLSKIDISLSKEWCDLDLFFLHMILYVCFPIYIDTWIAIGYHIQWERKKKHIFFYQIAYSCLITYSFYYTTTLITKLTYLHANYYSNVNKTEIEN